MAKYCKKPVVVEAVQWMGFDKGPRDLGIISLAAEGKGGIETPEGGYVVTPGDWIITGVKGEQYPCKPDIFEQAYEPVENGEARVSFLIPGRQGR